MANHKEIARQTRIKILEMLHRAQTSHIGSNYSATDLGVVLYENLKTEDRVCWSKGWCAALIYVLLARKGLIPESDLDKFPNPPYIGLAEPGVNGVETAGGSMGHGLPVAIGMALGKKRAGQEGRIFCVMSDGEMDEGTTWESAMLASHHKLDNLTVLIDYNKWQAMGRTNEVVNLEPLEDKWRAFGWYVIRIDGHDYQQIEDALFLQHNKPKVIIADTVKGKGVSFMEDHLIFHYKYVDDMEYKKAMKELKS